MKDLDVHPRLHSRLQPEFVPAALWNRAYRELVAADRESRPLAIVLLRDDGSVFRHDCRILGASHAASWLTLRYVERLLKFLLWQRGGSEVLIAGADAVTAYLARTYSGDGERAFDAAFFGKKIFGREFVVRASSIESLPEGCGRSHAIGGNIDGCRIGFDLGGSDRKSAALIDGCVVHSEEIPWDPYFQTDPAYHLEGIHDSLCRAADHLPRVDAIGASAAGVYVNNEVRASSLFRGVPEELFESHVRRIFFTLKDRWGGVPFEVVNDGEVTALGGAMTFGIDNVLGVAMGTSMAGGYVDPDGGVTPWLNELAFAPVDYHPYAPRDEWSGDHGCGVQYFSQQGVGRLAVRAGFVFPEQMPMAERLVVVQKALARGDRRAREIMEAIGTFFGYALAHYAEFYALKNIVLFGRVSSAAAGEIITEQARSVLHAEFPELDETLEIRLPGETDKRHGQAIAAASLPALSKKSIAQTR